MSLRLLSIWLGFPLICLGGGGIPIKDGRVVGTTSLLFLSKAQENEAERGRIRLRADQSAYITAETFYGPAELNVLTAAQVHDVETNELLNVAVRISDDTIEVPHDYLGETVADRNKRRAQAFHSETSSSTRDQRVDSRRHDFWVDFRHYIVSRLCDYYAIHPERFKPIGPDEEVTVEGFAEFVSKDEWLHPKHPDGPCLFRVHKGEIIDPWGEPVHFVQNRDGDAKIKARGFESIVMPLPVAGEVKHTNKKEQLGVCKHSAKSFEAFPHDCIFVPVYSDH